MEKRFTTGLILGKFMPPHKGHYHLIEQAAQQCENVCVVMYSRPEYEIDPWSRIHALRAMAHDLQNVHVLYDARLMPDAPKDHPLFWQLWRERLRELVPDVQAVFTSEDYGDRLADELRVQHVQVDKARLAVPISGSELRRERIKNQVFLPLTSQGCFIHRVAVLGPESTGKSTISEQLAKRFNGELVLEYGREYVDRHGGGLCARDFTMIAAGQLHAEEEAVERATATEKNILICDTEMITTLIWAKYYNVQAPRWIIEQSYTQDFDLYLLMKPDIPWIQDGTRISEQNGVREDHFAILQRELKARNKQFLEVGGSGEERLANAIAAMRSRYPSFV